VIKILVVDDSALMRKLLGEIFRAEPDFEVRTARDGVEALDQLHSYSPDVITLDVHMPQMDGLACLDRIMLERPCPVVMVSAVTIEGANATFEALDLGAVDFITKPDGAISLGIRDMAAQLVAKVRGAAGARLRRSLRLLSLSQSLPQQRRRLHQPIIVTNRKALYHRQRRPRYERSRPI